MDPTTPIRLIAGLCLLGALGAQAAPAQQDSPPSLPRSLVGATATVVRPVGEFQQSVGWGGGLSLGSVIGLRQGGPLGLRLEGSIVGYGYESQPGSVDVSRRIGANVVRVNTNNVIMSMGVGPQLTYPSGRVRPYAYGTVGFSYFVTVTSVTPVPGGEPLLSETHLGDFNPALVGGAGVLLRLGSGPHSVSLDLAIHGQYNGEVRYLRRGSITDNADGSVSFDPITSQANLIAFRIGIAIGV